MAKLSEIIPYFQKCLDEHGDLQVVFVDNERILIDIVSCGVSKNLKVKDQVFKIVWLMGEGTNVEAKESHSVKQPSES